LQLYLTMTGRFLTALAALLLLVDPYRAAVASDGPKKHSASRKLTKEARETFLRSAQIWTPTHTSEVDIRSGPPGPAAFRPDELVTCDFVPTPHAGSSRKFNCKLGSGDVVKVRYGADNPEVEGSVLATRLLWALGFGGDAAYPVRVICRGCSDDPWNKPDKIEGSHVFDIATIERKAPGHEMQGDPPGWAWRELDALDEASGGAPRAQRDALKLLAVLMQHTDNKSEQQSLDCLPGGLERDGPCTKPFLILHDVGLTFGHANYFNRNVTASVNFDLWSKTPIWRNQEACIGHLGEAKTGTLADPKIGEDGRAFLADLLAQLTDQQIHDLFEIGHVERRSRKPNGSDPPASVDEWAAAFRQKRADIASTRCPT
jgi:hypothetical protein